MFIYNVTTKVSATIQVAWLQWLKEAYNPKMLATGCFSKVVILKLKEVDDSEGPTYATQYYAANEAAYHTYLKSYAGAFRKECMDKWGDQIIAFSTLMEVVH